MQTMDQVISRHCVLEPDDREWLDLLVDEWSLLADLSFADLILWVPDVDDNVFWACAQVRPTTGPTSLEDDVVGDEIAYDPEHLVTEAYLSQEISHTSGNKLHAGIPVDVQAIPIMAGERCLALVEMHTNQMGVRAPGALEDAYLEAAQVLAGMVHRHQFPLGGDRRVPWVSPRVGDGMIRVDQAGTIVFASPNALSAYRRLGLTSDLYGEDFVAVTRSLLNQKMPVERPVAASLSGRGSAELDLETPTANVRLRILPLTDEGGPDGLLVMCRDTTELRSRERQLVTKDATIREIHHRVKNNLQTVAALLRLQARRIESPEAKGALGDAMKRVAAIAVVHEILSQAFDSSVKFDDVADRLLRMVGDVAATGGKVRMVREGSFGYVPADVATSLSLVLTELCQNAVEHGLRDKSGEVLVIPKQADGELNVVVKNFGEPLPEDFQIGRSTSLGLSIVSTLVADLGGEFTLTSDEAATTATVRVPLR
ncbi:MAG TPA: histidine kinase N-terminal domain-containing protein [Propionicimonas sp.]|nr:histidine kinase N-terminal domain-containing protein [Propionicimonas sp.]HRA05499.1 histidine kinase N-terminal domain-containing protein [Propionicimonas sp.]